MRGRVSSQMINGAAVIYQQGGSNGPRTRTSLYDALSLAQDIGAVAVLCDGNLGQPQTEAKSYDWANIALGLALWTGNAFSLDVIAGTTFSNLETITGGLIVNNKASAAVMGVTSSLEVHLEQGAGITSDATCTAPFFAVSGSGTLLLNTASRSIVDGQGAHSVIDAAAGTIVLITCAPSPDQVVKDDSLSGAGDFQISRGATIDAVVYKWANVSSSQAGIVSAGGTLTIDPP